MVCIEEAHLDVLRSSSGGVLQPASRGIYRGVRLKVDRDIARIWRAVCQRNVEWSTASSSTCVGQSTGGHGGQRDGEISTTTIATDLAGLGGHLTIDGDRAVSSLGISCNYSGKAESSESDGRHRELHFFLDGVGARYERRSDIERLKVESRLLAMSELLGIDCSRPGKT